MHNLIAPSILAADFSNLRNAVDIIENSDAAYYHIDVMDGVFVPNISFGMPVISALKPLSKKPFDVHLMIVQPERYIKEFKAVGADILTVHYEVSPHLHRTLGAIKQEGMQAGVALNPHTPIQVLQSIIQDVDLVCLMSVNPGFGGQKFIENTYRKVEELKNMIEREKANTKIEIDGGVTDKNAKALLNAGADILVAGSFVFSAENPVAVVNALAKL
ncbi:MAG: ribulose-phosphate 3-epimerase [Luteibaculaceae bacterium]